MAHSGHSYIVAGRVGREGSRRKRRPMTLSPRPGRHAGLQKRCRRTGRDSVPHPRQGIVMPSSRDAISLIHRPPLGAGIWKTTPGCSSKAIPTSHAQVSCPSLLAHCWFGAQDSPWPVEPRVRPGPRAERMAHHRHPFLVQSPRRPGGYFFPVSVTIACCCCVMNVP